MVEAERLTPSGVTVEIVLILIKVLLQLLIVFVRPLGGNAELLRQALNISKCGANPVLWTGYRLWPVHIGVVRSNLIQRRYRIGIRIAERQGMVLSTAFEYDR